MYSQHQIEEMRIKKGLFKSELTLIKKGEDIQRLRLSHIKDSIADI